MVPETPPSEIVLDWDSDEIIFRLRINSSQRNATQLIRAWIGRPFVAGRAGARSGDVGLRCGGHGWAKGFVRTNRFRLTGEDASRTVPPAAWHSGARSSRRRNLLCFACRSNGTRILY